MLLFITLFILALLVPVIQQLQGIDQPNFSYNGEQSVGYPNHNFILPRGQPVLRASIINQNKPLPRNKGKPKENSS
jgi:hypothetical protein